MLVGSEVFQKIVVVLATNLAVCMILVRDGLWYLAVVLLQCVHVILDVNLPLLLIRGLALLLYFLKSFVAVLKLEIVHNRTPAVRSVFQVQSV